jgi:3-oxoacyl-[acyl-carrier protein] reductase
VAVGAGDPEATLAPLAGYRNPDGGFGWALEPDSRARASQPVAALHAFEIFEEIAPTTSPLAGRLDWLDAIAVESGAVPFALPGGDERGIRADVGDHVGTGSREVAGATAGLRTRAVASQNRMAREKFSGRVALVTGGSGGIGGELSTRLAEAGATVAVHYAGNRESAERVAAAIADDGGRAATFAADLREADAPIQLADAVEAELGPVDILVANAGLSHPGSYEDVDAAAFDETLAVNLRAPYLLARRVLPGMRERRFGRILFTSSVAAFTGGIVGPHYASSKAGLHGLTHFLASRVAGDGVTVNAIAPALVEETGMLPGDPSALARSVPVGRLGRPVEVAGLAFALLDNGYVTNQVISVDGGIHPR